MKKKPTEAATVLSELNNIAFKHQRRKPPRVPTHGLELPKHSDKSANDLTKYIVLNTLFLGGYATHINVQDHYNEQLGRRTKSGYTSGTADVIGCRDGTFLSIGINKNDQQLKAQKETEQQVKAASGFYQEVRSFQEFNNLISQRRGA